MSITVAIKNVYGKDLIYPICDKARLFTSLTNKVTLSKEDIEDIKGLGFTVDVQQQSL